MTEREFVVPLSCPCVKCGHDLAGTPADAHCASCGLSAAISYQQQAGAKPRRHASARSAIAINGFAAATVAALTIAAIGVATIDDLNTILLAARNASPFIGMAILATILGRNGRWLARGLLLATVLLCVWSAWWYVGYFRTGLPGIAFVFSTMPLISWVGVAGAAVIGVAASLFSRRP